MVVRIIAVLLLLGVYGAVSPVFAQSCTTTVSPISFGNANLLAGNAIDMTGTVSISCTGTANTTVRACPAFSAGTGGATGDIRYMTAGAGSASFNLFTDSGRTQIWGGGFGSTTPPDIGIAIGGTGSGTSGGIQLYARIYPGQNSALTGTYASDITIMTQSGTTACGSGATTGGSFLVSALYETTCTLNAPTLDFGSFGSLPSNLDASNTLTIACSNGSAYVVSLDGGTSGATNPELRQMSRAGNTLRYALYRDMARSLPWGNTTGSNTLSSTGTGAPQLHPVYGRIPVQTLPPPGAYTDTVVVMVTN